MIRATLLTTALALTAVVTLSACDQKQTGQAAAVAAPARPPAAVTVVPVVTRDVPIYLDRIGRTVAVQSVDVVSQVAGKIVAAHVNDGDYVTKGQLLFEIDPRPYQAVLDQANATLAQAKSDLALAESEVGRMQNAPPNAVIAMDLDEKKSAVETARAKIEAANAAIEAAKLNLEYTRIIAPLSGRAGARLVDPGNVVKENDKTLLVIQQLDPIYAEFTITENELGTVRKYLAARGIQRGDHPERGLTALVDLKADAKEVLTALGVSSADAPATQSATATTRSTAGPREGALTFLDNTVQNGNGTIRLRATLPNADRYFWPGQIVDVRLVLATRKGALLIPKSAPQLGQQGQFVYVAKPGRTPDGKPETIAEICPITTGLAYDDLVAVDSGLSPDDQVITSGQMMIAPGGPVQILNAPKPAQPQQQAAAR